ncbi:MAG: polysaccharide biosynthesis tyrosine autokinase [Phycisphaerales bacterium]|nr:polysaccharide biosynthesis tyrosine autokinase [Phycisphaerales bacterium]
METSEDAEARRQSARFRAALHRYWWVVLLIWAIVAIPATVLAYLAVPPQYVAKGSIEVSPVIANPVSGAKEPNPFYSEYIRTQAEMIKSPFVLSRAAEDVRLKKYDWFRVLPDQIRYLAEHVQVVASMQAIYVTMTHKDAEAATAIVDSVIDAYFRARNELDEQNIDKSLKILKQLQATTDKSLRDAQEKLARLEADGSSVWTEDDRRIVTQVIANSRQTLGKLQTDEIALKAQRESLQSREPAAEALFKSSIPTEGDSQVDRWAAERTRITVLDGILASRRATPQHPDRVEYYKQLTNLEEKIADRRGEIQTNAWSAYQSTYAMDRARRTRDADADLTALAGQIANLQKMIADHENNARMLSNKTTPIFQLKEQIADSKEALKRYNDRIAEIENQTRAPGRVTLMGPTVQPKTPTVNRWPKLATAANGLALFLGLGTLATLTKLRNKIDHADDLPDHFQPLIVGSVSHAAMPTTPIDPQRKILSEEMRLLHANLLPPGRSDRRTMLITSPTPSNGKTAITANLGLSLARSGLDVLLIDADLRKRDLTTMFDLGFRPGLSDLLQNATPELVRPIEQLPNFRIMGAGSKVEPNPVELFQRRHFHEALAQLGGGHDRFDCILIDTPPALVVADARLIARSCDEILCVVRASRSSPREVNQTLDALARITSKTPKIIINGVIHTPTYYKHKYTY